MQQCVEQVRSGCRENTKHGVSMEAHGNLKCCCSGRNTRQMGEPQRGQSENASCSCTRSQGSPSPVRKSGQTFLQWMARKVLSSCQSNYTDYHFSPPLGEELPIIIHYFQFVLYKYASLNYMITYSSHCVGSVTPNLLGTCYLQIDLAWGKSH